MLSFRTVSCLVLALAVVVGGASIAPAADSVTVKLSPQNSSGESGTATLTKAGDKQTKVVLSVTGAPSEAQPTHIHKGTCAKLDPKPAFPLSPVVGGKSETTVNASLDDLMKDHAINGHKSAQDLKTYVFCGQIAEK
jgi:Cu/Zn superoxide dismutase